MAECLVIQTEMLLATDRACRERLFRAAESARMIRQAGPSHRSSTDDLLAEVGEALIRVGKKLQARHGADHGLAAGHLTT